LFKSICDWRLFFGLTVSKIILDSSLAESKVFVVAEEKVLRLSTEAGDSRCSPSMYELCPSAANER